MEAPVHRRGSWVQPSDLQGCHRHTPFKTNQYCCMFSSFEKLQKRRNQGIQNIGRQRIDLSSTTRHHQSPTNFCNNIWSDDWVALKYSSEIFRQYRARGSTSQYFMKYHAENTGKVLEQMSSALERCCWSLSQRHFSWPLWLRSWCMERWCRLGWKGWRFCQFARIHFSCILNVWSGQNKGTYMRHIFLNFWLAFI